MNTEIKTVKSRITKLLALGTSSNLSEASVAMAKAQQLMEEWALTIDDIDLGDDSIVYKVIDTKRKQAPELSGILVSLAEFTNLKIWVSKAERYSDKGYSINLLGYEADIEVFEFFWNVANSIYNSEFKKYKTSDEYADANRYYHGKAIRKGFNRGFTGTINKTLETLIQKNKSVVTRSGTALVPLKGAKIEEEFAEKFGFKLRTTKRYARHQTTTGSGAGSRAAANVNFNSAVGNNSSGGTRLLT